MWIIMCCSSICTEGIISIKTERSKKQRLYKTAAIREVMSTVKRLVLSLRGRKNSECNTATSSTRLLSAGYSPGHELDEIAIVSRAGTCGGGEYHFSYAGINTNLNNSLRHSTARVDVNNTLRVPEGKSLFISPNIENSSLGLINKTYENSNYCIANVDGGDCGRSISGCCSDNGGGIGSSLNISKGDCFETGDNGGDHVDDDGDNYGYQTTELCVMSNMPEHDDQCIDLGSVRRFSIDRHSYLDLGSKFGMPQPKFGQSVSQQGFFTSHDSLTTPCTSRASNPHVTTVSTASDMDLLHNKQPHKLRGRLKNANSDAPLLDGSWNRSTNRFSQDNPLLGSHNCSGTFCNGTERNSRTRIGIATTPTQQHQQHKQQSQQQQYTLHQTATSSFAPSLQRHHLHSHQLQQLQQHQRKPLSEQHYQQQQKHQQQYHHQQQHQHQHQQQQQSQHTAHKNLYRTSSRRLRAARKLHFVFDPAGRLCYYWSMVVSLAFLYNFWVIIYRFAFQEINRRTIVVWFCFDYFSDLLYLIDIFFHFRTGYLEDGVLQTDATKLRQHYMNSTTFYIDCLCLLPLDFLYLSIGFNSILRSFRLVKIYRFWAFMDRTERHTNYPNLFRSVALIHYLLVIFHWNGCLYHIIHKNNGFGSRNWVYHDSESADVVKQYLQSYYWCTLALTTIGDLPKPRSKGEYVFVIIQLLFGLMLFATVLGHVANIVTSVSAARKEFQAKLDGVKTYMRMRRVPNHLQVKVIKWFDYLWLTQKCSDEERAVSCLPDKLKAEIAINVHLDTLKRVEIFQNTEAGFLCELVLRLRPVLFSPGDYICRKGEVGKEMYIVNRGRLQVVADNGKTVMASLKAGSYFGEISILNMGTAGKELGNRRTASVRSVGYSDLFVLSKKDMWDVLKEYPAARVRLEAIAVKRLEKYKKAPLQKVAMGRCHSTPGLVESCGRTTLEDMYLPAIAPMAPHPLQTQQQQQYQQKQQQQILHSLALSRASSPRPKQQQEQQISTKRTIRTVESPGSVSPSVHSSEGRPHSRATTRPLSQPSRTGHICDSSMHLERFGTTATTPLLGSHEALEDEIKRLRERLRTVESENQALNTKLSQQQWDLENRLAEIEMQICRASSTSSMDPENDTDELERNRESII